MKSVALVVQLQARLPSIPPVLRAAAACKSKCDRAGIRHCAVTRPATMDDRPQRPVCDLQVQKAYIHE